MWSIRTPPASRLAGRHLLELGHTRPAVLAGPWSRQGPDPRLIGLCEEFGIPLDDLTVIFSDGIGAAAGYEAGLRLADRLDGETAVFVSTISLAFGLLKALTERGISIPGDVSVLSLHDEELANFTSPSLTTIAMPTELLGATAVGQLVDAIEGRENSHVVLNQDPILVPRQSTAAKSDQVPLADHGPSTDHGP